MDMERETKAKLKERAIEEFKLFWIIALYLWVFWARSRYIAG